MGTKFNSFKECRLKYVQPAVRESFRPISNYQRPDAPIADESVYKQSFPNIDPTTAAECRLPSTKPNAHVAIDKDIKLDTNTTMGLSYPGHRYIKRTPLVIPPPRIGLGKGPMPRMTTNKHDYVPKPVGKTEQFRPTDSLASSNDKLDTQTTFNQSYANPEGFTSNPSFKPYAMYMKPEQRMSQDTTHKTSYMPVHTPKVEVPPWAVKGVFKAPETPMENTTTQKESYLPPGVFVVDCDGGDTCTQENQELVQATVENEKYPRAEIKSI